MTHFYIQVGKGKKGSYQTLHQIVGDKDAAVARYNDFDTRSFSNNPPKKRLVSIEIGGGGMKYRIWMQEAGYCSVSVGLTPKIIGNRLRTTEMMA